MRLSAPVSSRAAKRRLGQSAARIPGAELWQKRRWELLLSLSFSLQKQTKQKDFQTCLGRDRMPNGLAPSSFHSCYLSRPVVWGESVRGPNPTRSSRLWGRGPFSWCTPWGEWSRQNWVWKRGQSGVGCLQVWCYHGVVEAFAGEKRMELAGRLCSAEGVWDLVPPTRRGSC